MTQEIEGIKVTTPDEAHMSRDELRFYVRRGKRKHQGLKAMSVKPDGEFVDIEYITSARHPFQRLRRITGYLVGTLDRFNNGKRAEEHDRVKHTV